MTAFMSNDGLLPGFSEPVLTSQQVFRTVLEAMARPGTIVELALHLAPPAPLDPATAAIALTLMDYETPLWLDGPTDTEAVGQYLRFHCGCPQTRETAKAAFAIITDPTAMPPLSAFHAGSDEFPDQSTTVIVQVPTLTAGAAWQFTGPGIRDSVRLSAGGFPKGFHRWIEDNHELFPRGVDLIFACGRLISALPRSTRLEG